MANIRARKTLKGVTRYQAFIRIKGYKPIMKTFDRYSKAVEWAKKIEVQMKEGVYKEEPQVMDMPKSESEITTEEELMLFRRNNITTVSDAIFYFKTYIAPNRYVDLEKYIYMYDWWNAQLGTIKLINLTSSMISSCKQILATEKIEKGDKQVVRKNNTINKYLMCFSAVLTYVSVELEIIEMNPMKKIKTLPTKGRKRFASIKEIAQIHDACKEHSSMVYLFFILLLVTGGRYSEVLHLCVENIDFISKQVYYLDTKNKESRGVPIDDNTIALIKNYLIENNITSGNIFIAKRKDGKYPYIRSIMMNIFKTLGLEDFHIHDIRHTTASYVAMNGGSLLDIAEILGHKSLVMARRYSHLTQKHTATVLQKVRGKLLPNI